MPINLTKEQQDAVSCRGRDTLVSAAAGSGKTRVIVERILDRISGPEKRNIDDFLVITFTNAAAAELRERFEKEISARISACPSDRHMRRQLSILSKAQITTIDAFCFSVLREFSHLCDINAAVTIAEGAEAELLRAEALENTLESLYEEMDALPDFAALAGSLSAARDDRLLADAISEVSVKLQSHPFPEIWMTETMDSYIGAGEDFGETMWGGFLLDEAISSAGHAVVILKKALELLKEEPSLSAKYSPTFQSDLFQAEHFIEEAKTGWDRASEAALQPLAKLGSAPRDYPDPDFRDRIKSMREIWKSIYGSIGETISENSSVHIAETKRMIPAFRGLFTAAARFEDEYRRLKTARNQVDFNDVSHAAIRLLCRMKGGKTEPTETAELIGSRYAEVLIDEFQDTNGIQTLIADMLTRGRNNLFMVGDVKQSIYRFRLAEPEIFLKKYDTFSDYSAESEAGKPARIVLSQNFRSRPEVIGAVNGIFMKLMTGGYAQIAYGSREMLYNGRECVCEPGDNDKYLPEFDVIDVPKAYDDEEDAIEKTEAEAQYVASRIRSMLDGGFEIEDTGAMRKVRPGDIAILMRSASKKSAYFERALSAQGIDSYAEKGGSAITAELHVIMSILNVIDNAYQDIPLIGAMTSPVYGFSPDELASIRSADRAACMYEAVVKEAESGSEKCRSFLDSISGFRAFAADSGADRLIWHIYSATGLPGIFSAMANGAGRRKNLMRFYEYAVRYSSAGRHGIYGFLAFMEKAFENGSFAAEDTSVGDAVRIMTIHKSKGMEFPVVFICDLSSKFNLDDARKPVLIHPQAGIGMKLTDQERMYQYPTAVYTAISRKIREESLAEEMRILYVAMTRAKDKLIMTCAFPDAVKKLQSILKNAADLDPEYMRSADGPSKWLIPILAAHHSGKILRELGSSHAFYPDMPGEWTVGMISESPQDEKNVNQSEDEPVSAVSDESKQDIGSEPDLDNLKRMISERLEYRYPFEGYSLIPSKLTATQLKGKTFDSELAEEAEVPHKPAAELRRPRFVSGLKGLSPTEKGTALHLAMQFIDLLKCKDLQSIQAEIERLREHRILSGLQADEVKAEKILRFVSSDLGKRVFASPGLQREFKFSILDDCSRYYPDVAPGEKILVQGVCDLFFEESDGITVVDFKSDRIGSGGLAEKAEEYRPQIELYAYALERITGKKVKEKILYFFAADTPVSL